MSAIASIKYGTRRKECFRIYDNELGFVDRTLENVNALFSKWKAIEEFEFAKRKNGKPLSKMIMLFPNHWTLNKKEEVLADFLHKKFQDRHHFTFCFHGGKDGEVAENAHGHLYYSERILTDSKRRKNPAMTKLGYLKDFSRDWKEACGIAQTIEKAPRIPMKEWKKNPSAARDKKVGYTAELNDSREEMQKTEILLVRKKYQRKKLGALFFDKAEQSVGHKREAEIQSFQINR